MRFLREGNPAYPPRTGIHYRHSRYDRRGARATSCGTTQCRATKSHWFYPHSSRIGHNDSSRLGDIRQVQVNLRKGRIRIRRGPIVSLSTMSLSLPLTPLSIEAGAVTLLQFYRNEIRRLRQRNEPTVTERRQESCPADRLPRKGNWAVLDDPSILYRHEQI
jgi:hypothetical protein